MSDEEAQTLRDVVGLLGRHHERITSALPEVLDETGMTREAAFAHLKRLLSVHEALEQVVIHPPAERHTAAARVRVSEENEISKAITQLEAIGPRSGDFDGAYSRLRQTIRAHFQREEAEEFPSVEGDLSDQQRAQFAVAVTLLSAPQGGSLVDGDTYSEMFDRARDQIEMAVALDAS
jgi:hypothetical protein